MTTIYNTVAKDAAKFIWKGISSVMPHIATWFAADTVGDVADWAMSKKAAAEAAPAKKQGFFSRLNPLNVLKKLNPVSAVSFAARPFLSAKKAISWFIFEDLVHAMKDKTDALSEKLAPIAENFLTPILEKVTTPVIDYLQNNGLMEIPKAPVTCPVTICETVAPSFETLKEVAKQATTTEQTGGWFSTLWNAASKPLVNLKDLTGNAAPKVATTLPLKEAFKEFATTQPIVDTSETLIKEAAKAVTQRQIPEGYLGLTEKYAEPAGRYVAQTLSTAYNGVTKLVQKPADLTHAVQESANVFADAIGVRPAYVYAAGAGIALLASYGLYSGLRGWTSNNTAVANANANAQGGNALGNQVNLIVNVRGDGTPVAATSVVDPSHSPQRLTAK